MTFPGFRAELTLADRGAQYETRTAGVWTAPVVVTPALLSHGCYARCLADQNGDPYAPENCRCICYGHPGRTCWLI
jgi:hypothetical protein